MHRQGSHLGRQELDCREISYHARQLPFGEPLLLQGLVKLCHVDT